MSKNRLIKVGGLGASLVVGLLIGALVGSPATSVAQQATNTTVASSDDGPKTDRPCDGRRSHHGRLDLGVAAAALGLTDAELRAQLAAGMTIADVAADQDVAVQKVIGALVADASARIDEKVADGSLTATEAATLKGNLTQRVTDRVNSTFRFSGHFGRHLGASLESAAAALGVTEAELRSSMRTGQTLAEIAAAKNVPIQKVIDSLVATAAARIDEKVASGDITSAQAAALKEQMVDRVAAFVNGERSVGHKSGLDA